MAVNTLILRKYMPQIKNDESFCNFLLKHNIKFTQRVICPKNLVPRQKDFNKRKVVNIYKNMLTTAPYTVEVDQTPVIVDQKGNILDGHHRWAGALVKKADVNCIIVHCKFSQLFKLGHIFAKKPHKFIFIL